MRTDWKWGKDGSCRTMAPGKSYTEYRGGYPPYVRNAYQC